MDTEHAHAWALALPSEPVEVSTPREVATLSDSVILASNQARNAQQTAEDAKKEVEFINAKMEKLTTEVADLKGDGSSQRSTITHECQPQRRNMERAQGLIP